MTPLLIRRHFSVLALAALIALRAPAFAADAFDAVLVDSDPQAAAQLLTVRHAELDALKASDPARYNKVFERSLELKDLTGLLVTYPSDSRAIRLGISQRPGCAFCQKPAELFAWLARYHPGVPEPKLKSIREALWDWSEMPQARRDWLVAHGEIEAGWLAMEFAPRQAKLVEWAMAEKEAILKIIPRTMGEVEQLDARVWAMTGVLPGNDAVATWHHAAKSRQLVEGLEAARKKVGDPANPKIKALLAAAGEGGDVDARLASLSALFDAAGMKSAALKSAAPPKPGQAFNDDRRNRVAGLLQTSIMREIAGTWAGDELKEFYSKVPLKIAVVHTDMAAIAWYWKGKMSFNEDSIEKFVKVRGRQLDDLGRDPALLKELTREVAPIFVHEAKHHQQDVWAQAQGIPSNWSQHQEQEAMMAHALYGLEKSKRDPTYAKYLKDTASSSGTSRQLLGLMQTLRTEGADAFGRSVVTSHYPDRLSLEGIVWCQIVMHNAITEPVKTEIARRAAMTDAERSAFDKGPGFEQNYSSFEAFVEALRKVNGPSLTAVLDQQQEMLKKSPEVYAKYAARLEQAIRETAAKRDLILSGKLPARRRSEPPVPGGAK